MQGCHQRNKTVPGGQSRRLIITADDFGLDEAINEAVEIAWREGVLTAAALMVGAPATSDAVARARRMKGLGVGLHLVLTDGQAVLPPEDVSLLTDSRGKFGDNMVLAGIRFFFDPRARRQLEKEIRAQFDAFASTGLELDHVSAHKHFHLHPTVLALIIRIGSEYGLKAVRCPWEVGGSGALKPWLHFMRVRLSRAGLHYNDGTFGLRDTGQMDEERLTRCVMQLTSGVTEIYSHPAVRQGITPAMRRYRHVDEFSALISPRTRDLIAKENVELITFRDIGRGGRVEVSGPAFGKARL